MRLYLTPSSLRGTARAVAALALFAAAAPGFAADFLFTGTFAADNDLALYRFDVAAPGTLVTLRTDSYAAGGFDPLLTFATGDRVIAGFNDDQSFPTISDSFFQVTLDPGTYFVALTQYDNAASGPELLNGFVYDANPNYTLQNALDPSTATGNFYTFDGTQRTGQFSLRVENVAAAAPTSLAALAPEPASVGFFVMALPAALLVVRRRRAH